MKITEIIPDNVPEWFQQDMAEGQLFNRVIKRVEDADKEIAELEETITNLGFALESKSDEIAELKADIRLAIKTPIRDKQDEQYVKAMLERALKDGE